VSPEQELDATTPLGAERSKDVVIRTFEMLRATSKSGKPLGVASGFTILDNLLGGGFEPGQLIVLASRPGMGKTALALNIAVNACHARLGTDRPAWAYVFSVEQTKDQLMRRVLSSESSLNSVCFRAGGFTKQFWEHLPQHAASIADLPLLLDDTPRLTTAGIREKIEQAGESLALVVIDSLHMIQPQVRGDTREREVSETVRELKLMARELRLPILVTGALNRGPIQRGPRDRRPRLEDMRDSGTIEDEADVVLLLHREEPYDRETLDQGIAEVTIAKQRIGPTGSFRLRFYAHSARFADLTDEPSVDPKIAEALEALFGKEPSP